MKAECAAFYGHPAVRWLLGGELHPGGAETTRLALRMASVGEGDELLDVASGAGDAAVLAASELGARAVGVEYGEEAVAEARRAALAAGLGDRVEFLRGDAEALPVADGSFDAALCECSLCTFADKGAAAAELRRALRVGGRLALADVVVDEERLPGELRGTLATIACVGAALPAAGYEELLEGAGFELAGRESRAADAAALAERVEDRLRGARVMGFRRLEGVPVGIDEALAAVAAGRRAVEEGSLGYEVFAAVARGAADSRGGEAAA